MTHFEQAVEVSRALRAAAFKVALDDFGLGLASTEHIRQLAVHTLKIDRAYIGGGPHQGGSSAIVQYAVELAAILGIDVVAEGVETPDRARGAEAARLPVGTGLPVLARRAGRRDAGPAAARREPGDADWWAGPQPAIGAAPAWVGRGYRAGCRPGASRRAGRAAAARGGPPEPRGMVGLLFCAGRFKVPRAPRRAGVAQLVEQLIRNQQVGGSSPFAGSRSQGLPAGVSPCETRLPPVGTRSTLSVIMVAASSAITPWERPCSTGSRPSFHLSGTPV